MQVKIITNFGHLLQSSTNENYKVPLAYSRTLNHTTQQVTDFISINLQIGLCSAVLLWFILYIQNDYDPLHPQHLKLNFPSSTHNSDTLVNLQNFQYVMNNVSICTASDNGNTSTIIMVHTARSHFQQRYAIRNTWGSIKTFKKWHLHLIFLLGSDPMSSLEFNAQLSNESNEHGDMIMGNFIDSYGNLSYKHLMG